MAKLSPDTAARKKLYRTARWQKARARFLAANANCATCGSPARVVDHKHGHGDNWQQTFWDPAGWQSLCQSCHSTKTTRESYNPFRARSTGRGRGESQTKKGRLDHTGTHGFYSGGPKRAPGSPQTAGEIAERLLRRYQDKKD